MTSGVDPVGRLPEEWREAMTALGEKPFRAEQIFRWIHERGVLDPATGARFRDEVLAVGGSRPAMESFRAFRGREPQVEALLRHSGMIASPSA